LEAIMKDLIPLFRVVINAIVRALVPALFDEARKATRDSCEDAQPQPELKAKLQNRVRATWGRAGALALCILLAAGCGTRTVMVPSGDPVRLRQPVKAKVWVMDANGNPVPSTMTLPEGWYVLPMPDDEPPPESIGKPSSPPVPLPPDNQPGETIIYCIPNNLTAALP
jgi:hypothetical protein